jgi:hypothetical protein
MPVLTVPLRGGGRCDAVPFEIAAVSMPDIAIAYEKPSQRSV